jgi:hypothetical protein
MMETQKLLCAPSVFKSLYRSKEVTIRKGRRDIKLGNLIFENIETHEQAHVWVDSVLYCRLSDVPYEFFILDGFENTASMYECMKSFYPDITSNSEVTVVKFNKG